ncbi:MAG TPA: immunoglobulin-like domain-containing protein [Longimicrobium sp.]|nr:immunoglobulin-like domain-containing protein [Longimicrobium sp.]
MVRSVVRYALATLAALTLAACESTTLAGPAVEITPDQPQYTAGGEVTLTLRNLGDEPLAYSFCTQVIQRKSSAGWITEHLEAHPCTAVLLTVNPGEEVTGHVDLPADLPAGTYRVYLPGIGEYMEDETSAAVQARKSSRSFKVTAG